MFTSVSALNQRIEELESHKLHLLSKLKGYGDKGGLEYIVKTQGLENIEARQFENRVVVENYDPQARRDEQEEMAQQILKNNSKQGQSQRDKEKKGDRSKEKIKTRSAKKGAQEWSIRKQS